MIKKVFFSCLFVLMNLLLILSTFAMDNQEPFPGVPRFVNENERASSSSRDGSARIPSANIAADNFAISNPLNIDSWPRSYPLEKPSRQFDRLDAINPKKLLERDLWDSVSGTKVIRLKDENELISTRNLPKSFMDSLEMILPKTLIKSHHALNNPLPPWQTVVSSLFLYFLMVVYVFFSIPFPVGSILDITFNNTSDTQPAPDSNRSFYKQRGLKNPKRFKNPQARFCAECGNRIGNQLGLSSPDQLTWPARGTFIEPNVTRVPYRTGGPGKGIIISKPIIRNPVFTQIDVYFPTASQLYESLPPPPPPYLPPSLYEIPSANFLALLSTTIFFYGGFYFSPLSSLFSSHFGYLNSVFLTLFCHFWGSAVFPGSPNIILSFLGLGMAHFFFSLAFFFETAWLIGVFLFVSILGVNYGQEVLDTLGDFTTIVVMPLILSILPSVPSGALPVISAYFGLVAFSNPATAFVAGPLALISLIWSVSLALSDAAFRRSQEDARRKQRER